MNETAPPPPPTCIDPPRIKHVKRTVACIQCGYSLTGLPVTGNCPECGTPVADSLRGWQLAFTGRAYLKTLNKGLLLVVGGVALQVFLVPGNYMFGGLLGLALGGSEFVLLLSAAELAIGILVLWGYWQFTAPDPSFPALDARRSSRHVVRGAVIASAAGTVLRIALQMIEYLFGKVPGVSHYLLWLLGGVIGFMPSVVLFFSALRYAQLLGQRVPDALLARRGYRYTSLLPVIMIFSPALTFLAISLALGKDPPPTAGLLFLLIPIGPLIAVAMYLSLFWRLHRHIRAILSTGAPATLSGMT